MQTKTDNSRLNLVGGPTQTRPDTRDDLSARRPWLVTGSGDGWKVISANGQLVACYLSLTDACAIAACHELLQVVKAMRPFLQEHPDNRMPNMAGWFDSVIAKATPVVAHVLSQMHDRDEENYDAD